MHLYTVKLFHPDGQGGRSHEMSCESDDEALERLARLQHSGAIELWEGQRLVWRFEARLTR